MFENSPQSKCAVAYAIKKNGPEDIADFIYIVIVFSVTANLVLRILRCESEVTSMCTPAEDNILIVGTIVGSINLYDLKDFETSTYR
jgi:hypothetical protein